MLELFAELLLRIMYLSLNFGGAMIRYPIMKILHPNIVFNDLWEGGQYYFFNRLVGFLSCLLLIYITLR